MCFVEVEALKTKRYNKLMELVSGYDQSVYYSVDYEPHVKDLEAIELLDTEICMSLN